MRQVVVTVAVLGVLSVVGCSADAEPEMLSVTGSLSTPGASATGSAGETCSTEGFDEVEDIRVGTKVAVLDASGATVGLGELADPVLVGETYGDRLCRFTFTVADVPGDSDFYTVEVDEYAEARKTRAELNEPVDLVIE